MATKKKVLTKRPMVHSSLRLNRYDRDRAIEAAAKLGVGVSEFLRSAVRDKTARVFDELKLSA